MPISTENCKARLAAQFQAHPELIRNIYGEDPANEPDHSAFVAQAVKDAQTPAKWNREGKWSAKTYFEEYGSTYRQPDGQTVVDYYDQAVLKGLPVEAVKTVRTFTLDPAKYDSAVSYCVLERVDGALYVGAHVGD